MPRFACGADGTSRSRRNARHALAFALMTFITGMRRALWGLALVSLLAPAQGAGAGGRGAAAENAPVPVIVDTDMGADDWLAIAYVASSKNADLLGVTVVGNGLASCDSAGRNARHILAMSPRNAAKPVGCGSIWPMDGYASYPRMWRENASTMMGEIASAPEAGENAMDGPALLAKLLSESAEPVQILATGGLTNIATVLKTNPRLREKIRSVVSMGGAIRARGNLRVHGFTDAHANTRAEWNYYIDPVAARTVFESGVPVTLVPLDATNAVPLTRDFLARTQHLQGAALGGFVQRTFSRISTSTSNGEYFHWDPLAAAISLNPGLCSRVERLTLDVIAGEGNDHGLPNGQPAALFPLSNFEGRKRKPLSDDAAGATIVSPRGNPVNVCMHADAAAFENDFLATVGSN